jgi:hypothetical protein
LLLPGWLIWVLVGLGAWIVVSIPLGFLIARFAALGRSPGSPRDLPLREEPDGDVAEVTRSRAGAVSRRMHI